MSNPKWRTGAFYQFPDNPKRFPGVTSVIGKLDKPFLLPAAYRMWKAGEDHKPVWDAKRDLGTAVHEAIERGAPLFPGHELHGYVEQAHIASQEIGLDWFAHEITLVNVDAGYAGTADLWADKGRVIADWKTGRLYSSASLQISALMACTHQALDTGELVQLPHEPTIGWAVHIGPDEWEARAVANHSDQQQENMATFMGLLQAFHWDRQDWHWTSQARPFL